MKNLPKDNGDIHIKAHLAVTDGEPVDYFDQLTRYLVGEHVRHAKRRLTPARLKGQKTENEGKK